MDPIFRMLYYSEMYQKGSSGYHAMMKLTKNMDKISDYSIDEIAALCNTNAMTISRLVRKIGYRNFNEFRLAAKETVEQYYYLNRNIPLNEIDPEKPAESFLGHMERVIEGLRNSRVLEQIDAVCTLMHAAKDIHYYGPPFQSLYIIMLLNTMLMDEKEIYPFTSPENVAADLDSLGPQSVVLLEPNTLTTETELCRKVLERAGKAGAEVVIFDEEGSALLQFSPEHNLTYPGTHTASTVFSQQFVMNMLTMEYRARYVDRIKSRD